MLGELRFKLRSLSVKEKGVRSQKYCKRRIALIFIFPTFFFVKGFDIVNNCRMTSEFVDSENQIDNSSLLDSLLDGNDQIGGDAVGTSDEVNKSSKRMQYFGAVFNLANTVRAKSFYFSAFLKFFFVVS